MQGSGSPRLKRFKTSLQSLPLRHKLKELTDPKEAYNWLREQGGSDFPAAINMFQFSHARGVGAHIPPTAGNCGGSAPSVESVFGSDGTTAYGRTPLGNLSLAPPSRSPSYLAFRSKPLHALYTYILPAPLPSASSSAASLPFVSFSLLPLTSRPLAALTRPDHHPHPTAVSIAYYHYYHLPLLAQPLPLLPATPTITTTTFSSTSSQIYFHSSIH